MSSLMDVKKEKVVSAAPSFIDRIRAFDLLDPMAEEMGQTYILPPETGKITEIDALKTMRWENYWIYTNPDPERKCNLYTMAAEKMRYIPPRCMECWKVVVKPKTLLQLFMLYDLQLKMAEEDPDCWCKCGIEARPWVFGDYGGYFYNNSKEEGHKKYKQVRKLVSEVISPDVPVILKRGCTEFEQRYGPSDQWDKLFPKEIVEGWEGLIKDHVVATKVAHKQSDLIKKHVMNQWIDFAYDRGDPTVLELNDGRPLYKPVVTYHDEKEIKKGVKKNGKKSKR